MTTINPTKCLARVWDEQEGHQCCNSKKTGDYCKKHYLKSLETVIPCCFDENGQHFGLFSGRVDQPVPIFDINGKIAILWYTGKSNLIINQALSDGHEYNKNTREGKRNLNKSNADAHAETIKSAYGLYVRRMDTPYNFHDANSKIAFPAPILTDSKGRQYTLTCLREDDIRHNKVYNILSISEKTIYVNKHGNPPTPKIRKLVYQGDAPILASQNKSYSHNLLHLDFLINHHINLNKYDAIPIKMYNELHYLLNIDNVYGANEENDYYIKKTYDINIQRLLNILNSYSEEDYEDTNQYILLIIKTITHRLATGF